jgi:hypothetical protein
LQFHISRSAYRIGKIQIKKPIEFLTDFLIVRVICFLGYKSDEVIKIISRIFYNQGLSFELYSSCRFSKVQVQPSFFHSILSYLPIYGRAPLFTELLFADRFHPVIYLVAVIIGAGFHPACHAGDLCIRSPAVQFGMAAAEYAG